MTKAEIIEYLYENNVKGDITIEQIAEVAEDLADRKTEHNTVFVTGTQIGEPQPTPEYRTTWASTEQRYEDEFDVCDSRNGCVGCEHHICKLEEGEYMDIFEAEMVRRFVVAVEKIANALDRKTEQTEREGE